MKKMVKTANAFTVALAVFLVVSSVPGYAQDPARRMSLEEAKTKTFSLKRHEKLINLYYEQMVQEARQDELSEHFLAVHEGMKNGNYHFDLDTARKIMQELYPEKLPCAPSNLEELKAYNAP